MPDSIPFKKTLPFVAVLAPQVHTADETIDYYYDFSQSIEEFTRAFALLKIEWQWQPVTMQNYKDTIDAATLAHKAKDLLVFNLCDGDEINGVPGVSVIDYLEEKGLRQGKESKGRNPMGEVLLTDCGSIGFCSVGTAVMVYPDGTLYGQVTAGDVPEIDVLLAIGVGRFGIAIGAGGAEDQCREFHFVQVSTNAECLQ